ncbi:hypothetical protein SNE40_013789 [Patella caerulea]|uniref:Globin n=1 Tax=Patella caerulea TaxID=87958 RepID=A0AAN8JK01_PATCE
MGAKQGKLKARLKGSKIAKRLKHGPPSITAAQKQILEKSWSTMRDDISQVGIITFIGFFEANPEVKHMFVSFRSVPIADLRQSSLLRAHALRVMSMVEKCVTRLDELDKIEETMKNLGQRHLKFDAVPENIDLMGPHFVQAIRKCMEADWNKETEEAWFQLFKLMTYYMKEGWK